MLRRAACISSATSRVLFDCESAVLPVPCFVQEAVVTGSVLHAHLEPGLGGDELLDLDDVVYRALEGQAELATGEDPPVREPDPVHPAPDQNRDQNGPSERSMGPRPGCAGGGLLRERPDSDAFGHIWTHSVTFGCEPQQSTHP
eukprot:543062-Prorocentrum_minimum.AAC.1